MTVEVVIRYWAGARAAAGVAQETVVADSVADALRRARAARPGDDRYARMLQVSTVLVDGVAWHGDRLSEPLDEPVVAEILPPFAGGAGSALSK